MTSLADIQNQDNCREKVISLQNFLQGPCFYGQRRLCLALCILSSLYGTHPSLMLPTPPRTPMGTYHPWLVIQHIVRLGPQHIPHPQTTYTKDSL
jgi:hypothetical protein